MSRGHVIGTIETYVMLDRKTKNKKTKSKKMDEHIVSDFVEENLNLHVFATENKCQDITCIFQKLMFHKMFRHWNQWQSLILHRYFKLLMKTGNAQSLHFRHLQLKQLRDGRWVYSWAAITATNWTDDISEPPKSRAFTTVDMDGNYTDHESDTVCVVIAEIWVESKQSMGPKDFHNVVIVHNGEDIICIPFDAEATKMVNMAPLHALFQKPRQTPIVHQHEYPFMPLLWFHVAVMKKESVMDALKQRPQYISGTAFFEMHLVDALIDVNEPIKHLAMFARERERFAHKYMGRYAVLTG